MLVGRCTITRLEGGAVNPKSGKPRTLIWVSAPGERLEMPIPKKGHQGTRYYDGEEWPNNGLTPIAMLPISLSQITRRFNILLERNPCHSYHMNN